MLVALDGSVNFGHSVGSGFPVSVGVAVHLVVNSLAFEGLLTSVRVEEGWLMERFILVVPVTVLSSHLVGVLIFLSRKAGVVKKHRSIVVASLS